jgi:hypothetical protein
MKINWVTGSVVAIIACLVAAVVALAVIRPGHLENPKPTPAPTVSPAIVTPHSRPPAPAQSTPVPVNPQPAPSMSEPAGLVPDDGLDSGCTLFINTAGEVTGATLTFWNPTSSSVLIHQVGIQVIDNGVLVDTLTVTDPLLPETLNPQNGINVPVSFNGAESATSCQAGWT